MRKVFWIAHLTWDFFLKDKLVLENVFMPLKLINNNISNVDPWKNPFLFLGWLLELQAVPAQSEKTQDYFLNSHNIRFTTFVDFFSSHTCNYHWISQLNTIAIKRENIKHRVTNNDIIQRWWQYNQLYIIWQDFI